MNKRNERFCFTHRRILALLLAICLCLSSAPAVKAEPESSDTGTAELTYDFRAPNIGDFTQEYASSITYEVSEAAGSAPWAYLSHSKNQQTGNANHYFRYLYADNGLAVSDWLNEANLKIKVTQSGTYGAEVEILASPTCTPDLTISLCELEADGSAGTAVCSVKIDPQKHYTDQSVRIPLSPGGVALDAGKEYVLHCAQSTSGNSAWILQSLTLAPKLETVFYDFCAPNIGDFTQEYASSITYEASEAAGSAPWAYLSHSKNQQTGNANHYFRYLYADNGLAVSDWLNEANLKIKATQSGAYIVRVGIIGAKVCTPDLTISLCELTPEGEIGEPVCSVKIDPQKHYTDQEEQIALQPKGVSLQAGKEYALHCAQSTSGNSAWILKNLTLDPNLEEAVTLSAEASPGEVSMDMGKSAEAALLLALSDGSPVDFSQLTVDVESSNSAVAAAEAQVDEAGARILITGIGQGFAQIKAKLTYGEAQAEVFVNAAVTDPDAQTKARDLLFDFRKAWNNDQSTTYASTITYGMTTAGHGSELNKHIPSEPWAYHTYGGEGYVRYVAGFEQAGFQLYYPGSKASMKLKVPAEGAYLPEAVLYGDTGLGGITEVTLSRIDGQVLARKSKVDTGTTTGPIRVRLSETPIVLDAGEYIFSWAVTAQGAGTYNLQSYLQKFRLTLFENASREPRDYLYDFSVLSHVGDLSQQYASGIVREMTEPLTDPWAFHSLEGSAGSWFRYSAQAMGLSLAGAEAQGAVVVTVPTDGEYTVAAAAKPQAGERAAASLALCALAEDGSLGAELCAGELLADAEQESWIALGNGAVSLRSGNYALVCKNRATGGAWNLQRLQISPQEAQIASLTYDFGALYDPEDTSQQQADGITYAAARGAGSAPWAVYGWGSKDGGFRYDENGGGLTLSGWGSQGNIMLHVPAGGE